MGEPNDTHGLFNIISPTLKGVAFMQMFDPFGVRSVFSAASVGVTALTHGLFNLISPTLKGVAFMEMFDPFGVRSVFSAASVGVAALTHGY